MTKLKVGMISLGCNKNRVDSETALGLLREHGYELTNDPAQADVLMVNTCGFIASAKEESIDAILDMARYKQIGKCRVLVVTGCLAQRYEKDLMQEIPEIDLLMGVNQYQQLPDALEKALGGVRKSYCMDDHTYYAHDRVLTTPSYTAYTRIGEGCSNCCTFCAIPKIRGPYRSRPEADILREIESLAKQGVKEHILVAQDTSRYGMDFGGGSKLAELMQKAAKIDGVDWLRVLYCYPEETSEQLLDIIANTPNICSYVDLPIQHVNDAVLKRMHRRGTSADIRRAVKGAHERGITLRTSIIVGFPGETEEQFQELLDFLPEAEFDRLGAFTYSPRRGHARRENARPNSGGGQGGAARPADEAVGRHRAEEESGARGHGGESPRDRPQRARRNPRQKPARSPRNRRRNHLHRGRKQNAQRRRFRGRPH